MGHTFIAGTNIHAYVGQYDSVLEWLTSVLYNSMPEWLITVQYDDMLEWLTTVRI